MTPLTTLAKEIKAYVTSLNLELAEYRQISASRSKNKVTVKTAYNVLVFEITEDYDEKLQVSSTLNRKPHHEGIWDLETAIYSVTRQISEQY